jgi:hyperosmotically inducible protein
MTPKSIYPLSPETDGSIESSFKKSYVYQTYLKDDAVKTEARNGVVTLTGTVADGSHRTLAQETVASLPGVTRVDNNLSTRAEVDAENADTWIGRKVKLALLFHRNVSAGKTAVEVKDGVVTLKGEATSMAQKDLTSEYAKDIESVKEVKNMMTVAATPVPKERTAGEKMDDASVTAQVKTALLTHRSTKSVAPRVETRNGEITLTGLTRSAAEKSLVTKLVTDIHGVTGVKNQMTVAQATTK